MEDGHDYGADILEVAGNVGLPESEHCPAASPERSCCKEVAALVALDLREPVLRVRAGAEFLASLRPVSAMPEVSITEHDYSFFVEYEIGTSDERLRMDAIPESARP